MTNDREAFRIKTIDKSQEDDNDDDKIIIKPLDGYMGGSHVQPPSPEEVARIEEQEKFIRKNAGTRELADYLLGSRQYEDFEYLASEYCFTIEEGEGDIILTVRCNDSKKDR